MKHVIRTSYVRMFRMLRWGLRPTGLLAFLETRNNRTARWLRSLFAVYDLDDLVHLDIPWWTFEAIDAIDAFLEDRPNARVFEWGAGASTIWLSRRAAEVVAVEHDAEWANRVKGYADALGNVRLHMVAPARQGMIGSGKTGFEGQFFDEYVEFIHCIPGEFDLIVIDGRAREACLSEAVSRLAPSGLIVFDDFKRKRYQTALARHRFHIRQLDGLSACLPLPDSTALLSLADT